MIAPQPPVPHAWLRSASGLRLAVLGADGFIGSRLTLLALAAGADVTGICIKQPWRLGDVARDGRLRLVCLEGGRWWDPALDGELEGQDALALLSYTPPTNPSDGRHELDVNAAGAIRVGHAASKRGVRVLFASSAEVYGSWREEPVGESVPTQAATSYAKAKVFAESELEALSLRIATGYGPGEKGPRAIPAFIRALTSHRPAVVHGDGADVRDYVHVDDVAGAFLNAAITAPDSGALNIGSGVGRTTLEVLETVAAAVGVAPRVRYEHSSRPPSRLILDPSAARRELDFQPRQDFEAAVREEAQWLQTVTP